MRSTRTPACTALFHCYAGGVLASLWLVAKWLLLIAGLLGPGAALMRALRLPVTLATSFCGSAVALYVTVLGLQLGGVPLGLPSLTAGLALLAAGAWATTGLRGRECERADSSHHSLTLAATIPVRPADTVLGPRLWLAPVVLFFCVVLWRAFHEPLAGPDIEFRWAFLAEQMLRTGSLDFYPPRSAADFATYYWAESIPPGVAALHAWAFACAGKSVFVWTVPAVLLQIGSVYELLWRCAATIGGATAARCAVLAAIACPLLTWSLLLGQETGLATLSLLGMAWAYVRWRDAREGRWAAALGLFAVLGSSAREYGLVFPAIAVGGLLVSRASRPAWIAFGLAAALCIVWPLRCWVLTGNPVYSLGLGSLFPVNERFLAWIRHDAASFAAPLHSLAGWCDVLRQFALYAPAALLGWAALAIAVFKFRDPLARHAAAVVALILLLWFWSVAFTNGGVFYSLRVTSPACALGTLVVGVVAARFATRLPGFEEKLPLLLALLGLITLPATLALPRNPWRTPVADWPAFAVHAPPPTGLDDDIVRIVQRMPNAGVVIADAPGFQRRFQPFGVTVIPLWSPLADWLFDLGASPAAVALRWRETGVRTLLVTKWQRNLDFLNDHSRWNRPPLQVQMVGETAQTAVFSIRADP